jgi:hypothetical protein
MFPFGPWSAFLPGLQAAQIPGLQAAGLQAAGLQAAGLQAANPLIWPGLGTTTIPVVQERPRMRTAPPSTGSLPADVERFIIDNRLDTGASSALRNEPPDVQRTIINQGTLAKCANPSAALIGRIKNARALARAAAAEAGAAAAPNLRAVLNASMGGGGQSLLAALSAQQAYDPAAIPADGVLAEGTMDEDTRLQLEAMKAIQLLQGGDGTERTPELQEALTTFISEHNLDEASVGMIEGESPPVLAAVIARGKLPEGVSIVTALKGRIATAKIDLAVSGKIMVGAPAAPLDSASLEIIDKFLAENSIDERAAREFRLESAEVQNAVMTRGPFTNCANPSSALLARMRDAKRLRTAPY